MNKMVNKLKSKKTQEKKSASLICIISVVISLLICHTGLDSKRIKAIGLNVGMLM